VSGASIETTLELWASSLREVKARIRPLFTQERVAASAGQFLDGLLGAERRKTGWMRAEASEGNTPGPRARSRTARSACSRPMCRGTGRRGGACAAGDWLRDQAPPGHGDGRARHRSGSPVPLGHGRQRLRCRGDGDDAAPGGQGLRARGQCHAAAQFLDRQAGGRRHRRADRANSRCLCLAAPVRGRGQ
jgi:hypothetical protein